MTHDLDQTRFNWLTRLAFGLLLAIVIARCLMLEVVRETLGVGTSVGTGPGPTTSLILDWLTFVPTLLILVRRLLDADYALRFRWVHVALLALAAWTLVSVTWSSDRFLALIGGMQVLAGASLFWSASQLVRRWEHVRIVVGVCVGLLLANVVQAVLYRSVDLPDLHNFWQQNRETILAERGWKPGEYIATRFEQKLMAGELLGFNASANTLGAIVVMLALISFGAAMQRLQDRDDQGWVGIMFIAALSAVYPLAYTGSKASWGALLLGFFLLAIWRLLHRWLAAHRFFVFSVVMASIALAVVSVVAYGLSFGGLPEDSINFRWRYWLAAWESFYGAPVRGVGWGNFASAFLEHRLPVSAEEINDPHNFLVRWATELGLVGLLLGITWLVLWAWHASRPITIATHPTPPLRVHRVLWVGLGAYLLSLIAVDLGGLGETDRFFAAVLDMLRRVLLVGLVTIGLGIVCLRDGEHREVDSRPAPWLAAALFVGVMAFLLQSSIDIAFFQPGPFMLCLLILGTLLGLMTPDHPRLRSAYTTLALGATSVGMVIVLIALVIPVGVAEWKARYALRLTPNQPERAVELYEGAYRAAPVRNADYLIRAAEIARIPLLNMRDRALALLDAAIKADPRSIRAYMARAHLFSERPQEPGAIDRAVEDLRSAVNLNPNDVDLRIEFADLLEQFGRRREAAAQLSAALETNDSYDPAEPERLEQRLPGEAERIRVRIARLQSP